MDVNLTINNIMFLIVSTQCDIRDWIFENASKLKLSQERLQIFFPMKRILRSSLPLSIKFISFLIPKLEWLQKLNMEIK